MAILADKGKAAAAMHASIACMKMIMKTTSGSGSFSSVLVPVVLVATMFFAASALGFGAALDGYSQLAYPVAVLGAVGMPHAAAFNVLGFVVPGLVLAVVAMTLYLRLPVGAGGSARIGAWVLLFSALAFAAQGVFPLDLDDLDATTGRLHVMTWSLWWLTTGAGAVLLAIGPVASAYAAQMGCPCLGGCGGGAVFRVVYAGSVGQRGPAADRVCILVWLVVARSTRPQP